MLCAYRLPSGVRHSGVSRRPLVLACLCIAATIGLPQTCRAAPADDAFYHQLLKMRAPVGYQPTRSFTIVTDAERGNQLVAEDDTNLRFNLMWMQQFQPGYKARHGGSAFGQIFRSYVKTAYKSYRERNAQAMSALPDENGSVRTSSFTRDVDYNFKLTDDEVRLKVEYTY
jgi:hypothetical protein